MDFARPLVREDSIATKSNVRLVRETTDDDDNNNSSGMNGQKPSLDTMLLQASNQAARDLLLAGLAHNNNNNDDDNNNNNNNNNDDDALVDASLYTERVTPTKETIHEGDLVVIMEAFDKLTFTYVKTCEIYCNRHGHFYHQDFIGKPFGSKIRSRNNRGYGFLYLLKPTPELWARSLTHRTQIVHQLDQSQIVWQLQLRPNAVVVESGTGSGAMSHALIRTIAPHGHLHTYEFNAARARAAALEFASNGVAHLVTVHHKDVCCCAAAAKQQQQQDDNVDIDNDDIDKDIDRAGNATNTTIPGGFDLPDDSVDAVFLDLPEPWWAVPHAAAVLKPNARLASYSPCVEQTQSTVQALQQAGFHSIKTMEYRLQEHYVDEVTYESPPSAKRPRFAAYDHEARSKALASGATAPDAAAGMDGTTTGNDEKSVADDETAIPVVVAGEDHPESAKKPPLVVARPFASMRGHTAFLTFATAGIKKTPGDAEIVGESKEED